MISSVLERKVWALTRSAQLFPNLYIILVGPPGVGKSVIISKAEKMLRSMRELHVAPSSVTTASLADTMAAAQRQVIIPTATPNFIQFNSLQVVASELGVFLPQYESSYINLLTKLYDGEFYEERRRTGRVNHMRIDCTLLSILAGTQPSYLGQYLPEGAWDQGFTSRTIFIFAAEPTNTEIFSVANTFTEVDTMFNDLMHDFYSIAALYGELSWSKEAQLAITAWDKDDRQPVPMHGKLLHYNSRRLAHCLKLCMTASVARSSSLVVEKCDFDSALSWLLEAEDQMPGIFDQMGSTPDARAMEDCWHYLTRIYKNGPIPEHYLVDFLRSRVPSYQVIRVIDVMVRANMIRLEFVDNKAAYIPVATHRTKSH